METFINPDNITLESIKEHAINLIDKKTEKDIFGGFTFDSLLFSMSMSAQINWSNLFFIPDVMFPLSLSTKNDEGNYSLSLANRQAFYGAALTHKNTALQTGTYLKNNVKTCTTIEQVQTIIDSL